jgi:hypothetical protein
MEMDTFWMEDWSHSSMKVFAMRYFVSNEFIVAPPARGMRAHAGFGRVGLYCPRGRNTRIDPPLCGLSVKNSIPDDGKYYTDSGD